MIGGLSHSPHSSSGGLAHAVLWVLSHRCSRSCGLWCCTRWCGAHVLGPSDKVGLLVCLCIRHLLIWLLELEIKGGGGGRSWTGPLPSEEVRQKAPVRGCSLSSCMGPVKGLSVCRVLARHLACCASCFTTFLDRQRLFSGVWDFILEVWWLS